MVIKPESSFPTLWGDDLDLLTSHGHECPVSDEKIRQYLKGCHYNYCLDEEPQEFAVCRLREFFLFSDRKIWILQSRDGLGRDWDILVGSGRSPLFGEDQHRIWAEANRFAESVTPRQVLTSQFPEYESSAKRVN